MGDTSVMGRRLSENYIQYGWSGNGGYFSNVGLRLLEWYDTKDKDLIDNLFALGELSIIGEPGSEKNAKKDLLTHHPTGKPHTVGTSERYLFSKLLFVDYGYFYDSDQEWYYIIPGPFRIKVPLLHISQHLDEEGNEFTYRKNLEMLVLMKIFLKIPQENEKFGALITEKGINPQEVCSSLIKEDFPMEKFFDDYKYLYKFFDDWILIKTDEEKKEIKNICIKEKAEKHIETIFW